MFSLKASCNVVLLATPVALSAGFDPAALKVGAVVSTTMSLFAPKELAAPGEGNVSVASLPAASLIVPPLSANAPVPV